MTNHITWSPIHGTSSGSFPSLLVRDETYPLPPQSPSLLNSDMPPKSDHYEPKDAIKAGINGALVMGGAGLFAAAIQNSLQKQNVGAFAVFTRSGGTIATFSMPSSLRPH